MLTEKDYCDYETSASLKELGFNSLVDWYFKEDKSIASSLARYRNTYIPRISLYEAQKFLRENCNLHIEVRWFSNMWYEYEVKEAEGKVVAEGCAFPAYEEALSTAVRMAVEYLKEK